ncbi:hypothetical protein L484_002373 [Morus notabilis]|uniref:Uncharacterized protein n=1 Tax=Morus notabilis TaxID=981085 RepID=W9S8L6_9ROSA|nr:hypothetical protein L484_002373 [Morus notabilis]
MPLQEFDLREQILCFGKEGFSLNVNVGFVFWFAQALDLGSTFWFRFVNDLGHWTCSDLRTRYLGGTPQLFSVD